MQTEASRRLTLSAHSESQDNFSSTDEGHGSRATSRGQNLNGANRDGRNGFFGMELEAEDGDPPPTEFMPENRHSQNEDEKMVEEAGNRPAMDLDNHQEEQKHSSNDNNRVNGKEEEEEEDLSGNEDQEADEEEPKKEKIDWVSMIPDHPLPEVAQQIVEIGLRQKISCYGKLDQDDRVKLLHLNPDRAISIMRQLDLYWDNIVKNINDSYEEVRAILTGQGIHPSSEISDMIKEYVDQHVNNSYLYEEEEEEEEDMNVSSSSAN